MTENETLDLKDAPKSIVRLMRGTPDTDVEKRIIRNARIATNNLASDGWIIMPRGVDTTYYSKELPQVFARHGAHSYGEQHSPVIGRSLGIRKASDGIDSDTQFADTELGREYCYLYGCNEEKEVYMRALSISVDVIEGERWSIEKAKKWVGPSWDEKMEAYVRKWTADVFVAKKTFMREYSAVPFGADRGALQRAADDKGLRLAGDLVREMDLSRAHELIDELKRTVEMSQRKIEKVEREYQALRGEGASAATHGDSEAIVRTLDEMLQTVKKNRKDQ